MARRNTEKVARRARSKWLQMGLRLFGCLESRPLAVSDTNNPNSQDKNGNYIHTQTTHTTNTNTQRVSDSPGGVISRGCRSARGDFNQQRLGPFPRHLQHSSVRHARRVKVSKKRVRRKPGQRAIARCA